MTDSSRSSRLLTPADADVEGLYRGARACDICPTMAGRVRVLSPSNGPIPASIMLVGEAPGRRGAERTMVPFAGDESGRRLDALLDSADWLRDEIFITNAVLCNPQDDAGRNRRPSRREVSACGNWLCRQIELVNPTLVVALGAVALDALQAIQPHHLRVNMAGHPPEEWSGRWLAAVYHPGARAAIHRSLAHQHADFRSLGQWSRLSAGSAEFR